ncbi:MAG: hypothetical protein WAX77_16300 [Methylococcaceae bacterium]
MQKLPNFQQAFIDTSKNLEYSEGQQKSAVFKLAFNIGLAEKEKK